MRSYYAILFTVAALGIMLLFATRAESHTVTKRMCIAYGKANPPKQYVAYRACMKWRTVHACKHTPCHIFLPARLDRIRACESGARNRAGNAIPGTYNYTAQNPISTASGAFGYLDSTWGGHGGYAKARHAPRSVQDARALRDYRRVGTTPWDASRGCWS